VRVPDALKFIRAPFLALRAAWRVWNAASTAWQVISLVVAAGVAGVFLGIFSSLDPGWRFGVAALLLVVGALALSVGITEAHRWWFRYRNRDLGFRCIRLANEMNDYLADALRSEPDTAPTNLPLDISEAERHRDWIRGGQLRRQHEAGTLSGFIKRFRTRTVGLVSELVRKGHLPDDDASSLYWSLDTGAFVQRVPDTLAEKGYELTGGQDPP
jgi:hypothetical protein